MRSLNVQARRETTRALFAAWHVAAFVRSVELPELRPLMERVSTGATEDGQSPEEQLNVAREIAKAFGAEV